jgi:hypothetical protein
VTAARFYQRLEETGDGGASFVGRYRSTGHTVGPWDPHHQHAGPPTALLARAMGKLGHTPPAGLLARLTAEILAPIPVTDLLVRASVQRPGRRVAWVTSQLAAADSADTPLVQASGWVLRRSPAPLRLPVTPDEPAPGAGTPQDPPKGWVGGYLQAVEWSLVQGSFAEPGPVTVWTRLLVGLVDDESPTGVERAAVVADAGSGISAVADPQTTLFVNTELSIHLHREPRGPQVWMAARTVLNRHGIGLAETVLGDAQGSVGRAAQALFVEPR